MQGVLLLLRWLLYVAEIALALPVLYLVLLSISALIATARRKRRRARASQSAAAEARVNFGLLLPAHDEEKVLSSLLESLAALDYPKERYTVYVVADNCTDSTAALARAAGWVRVYERFDQNRRGKGYALNWIVQRLEDEQAAHDAYVVIDADSVVDPALLQEFARELETGAEAAQAYNGVLNIADSPSSALRWIALALVNHVRPLGRNGLGSSSTLTGNGMCLRRSLLQRHPWQSFSIGEDYQYYLTVVEQGVRVRYVPEAVVRSEMPVTFEQMKTQDVRWESAGSQPKWRIALRLVRAGVGARDAVRLEAVAELLTPPLSVLVAGCVLTLLASLLLWTLPGVLGGLGLIVGLLFFIASPLYLLRPPRAVYLALLHAPLFMLWKLWVVVALRRSKKHTSEWIRTSRGISKNQIETH